MFWRKSKKAELERVVKLDAQQVEIKNLRNQILALQVDMRVLKEKFTKINRLRNTKPRAEMSHKLIDAFYCIPTDLRTFKQKYKGEFTIDALNEEDSLVTISGAIYTNTEAHIIHWERVSDSTFLIKIRKKEKYYVIKGQDESVVVIPEEEFELKTKTKKDEVPSKKG